MARPKQRAIPVTSDRVMPAGHGEIEQQLRNVYLPLSLAQDVAAAGPDFNLSAAAQRGIRQALDGSNSQAIDRDQLDRIENTDTPIPLGEVDERPRLAATLPAGLLSSPVRRR